jgi:hypothetical protein
MVQFVDFSLLLPISGGMKPSFYMYMVKVVDIRWRRAAKYVVSAAGRDVKR